MIVHQFTRVVTLPYVLTEVSNLAGKLHGNHRYEFARSFAEFITLAEERHAVPARRLIAMESYVPLGLPDTAILSSINDDCLLITADDDLTAACEGQGLPTLPFYLLRQINE